VKYTTEGSITLRVEAQAFPKTDHVLLAFEVEDSGVGIASEHAERIFKPFEQVATTGVQEGTGLGLAITWQLVQLMGGSIILESTPGRGSCFRVELPVEKTAEFEPESAPAMGRILGVEAGQPEYRILVVEDEPENWMVLERLLSDAGFQVRVAQNGKQGVEMYEEWRPDFIWMDLRMPVMDGIEATRRIRALPVGTDVKIAAVSAWGISRRTEVLAAGMDDYLTKPYRPAEIFDCLQRHLGLRYLRAEAAPPPAGHSAELSKDAIAALPSALRAELLDAVTALNAKRISQAIAKVAEHDAPLGSVLAGYAERYAYTAILSAVEDAPAKLS